MPVTHPTTSTDQTLTASGDSKSFMQRSRIILLGLALCIVGGLIYQQATTAKAAPNVVFTTLKRDAIPLKNWQGKVVIVNFWATSCTTCVHEMPRLIETYERYKDQGLNVIAVAMSYDPPMYVSHFAETRQLPFDVALDSSGDAARQFGQVEMTPTTFVINKQGKIIKRYLGEPDFAEVNQLLEQALAAPV